MSFMRWLVSIVVWGVAAAMIWVYCVRPLQCNHAEFVARGQTDLIEQRSADQVTTARYARENIALLAPCLSCAPGVNRAMLLAANLRFVGRGDEAVAIYRDALHIDRRPELYLQMGKALVETGHDAEALDYLIKACMYNPEFEDELAFHHDEIKAAVDGYITRLLQEEQQRGGH